MIHFNDNSELAIVDTIFSPSLSVFLDAFPDALLLVDDQGMMRMVNLAAQKLTGYTHEQLLGKSIDLLIPARYRARHRHYEKAYFKDPRKRTMRNGRSFALLKQDQQEISVDIDLRPITISDQSFALVNINIANQQFQVEQELQEIEERLLLAKQAAGLGIFDLDLQHQIIYQDERMSEFWGEQSTHSCTYETFFSAIHPKDRALYQAALNKAIDPTGDGEFTIEVRVIQARSGSEKWINSIGRVHFIEGVANRVIGIAQDITKQKMLEKALQNFRSEEESLFKQQVAIHTASAIAHELNQPLTAISAYSEVALNILENNPNQRSKIKESLQNCVTQAQRAGDSLHELIASLHKADAHIENLDLNEIILDASHAVRSNGFSDFHQILQLESNLPTVSANRVQIKKAVINLLRNAVEAMSSANVTNSAITITVNTIAKEKLALVTIEDRGPGINPQIVHHIFDPFFTTKSTGIGMGLSISRALIEANGGQLWIDPHSTTGAKFYFTLPFTS